jgi:hypothetical protein
MEGFRSSRHRRWENGLTDLGSLIDMRLIIIGILLLAINGIAVAVGRADLYPGVAILSALLGIWAIAEGIIVRQAGGKETPEPAKAAEPAAVAPKGRDERTDAEIVHFLGLFQQKGRLVDFLMEDVTSFSNEQVGAAARVVHQGCSQVVKEFFVIEPAHQGEDGSPVTLEEGYDSAAYQLSGKLEGSPPFKGTLAHHGWVAREVKLPRLVKDSHKTEKGLVIAPAEVEVKK